MNAIRSSFPPNGIQPCLPLIMLLLSAPCLGKINGQDAKLFDNRPMHNVSKIIDSILEGYDIRLRPQFGRSSLGIDMELVLASFDSISEVNMDYTITIYLNQYWQDERLAFSKNGSHFMTLTGDFAEKIWVPDTFFANDKNSFLHDVTEKNKMVRLHGDGSITYGMRFTTTLACMMDLHHYPLDKQNCTVEIESYGYPMQDVIMRWKGERNSITGVDNADIPQFSIVQYHTSSTVERLATGDYQRLSLSFTLRRNVGYFIFQTYLPSILIVMLSWVSFWINHEATSARVALGITTVLTMTTISTGVRSSLPRISYVKAIDIYLVMCFVFVFAALLEYAAVNYTYWGARAKRKAKRLKEQKRKFEKEYEDTIDIEEDICETSKRMSPLQSLRSQQTFNYGSPECTRNNYMGGDSASGGLVEQPESSTHTFRISSKKSCQTRRRVLARTGTACTDSNSFGGPFQRRRKVMATVRKHAKRIGQRLPTVKDVNKIDKYSRLFFPSLFIVFNICYWCYYLLQE